MAQSRSKDRTQGNTAVPVVDLLTDPILNVRHLCLELRHSALEGLNVLTRRQVKVLCESRTLSRGEGAKAFGHLDEQIHEFDARPYLGPEDQVELVRLKKLKLRKKDEIAIFAARLGLEI